MAAYDVHMPKVMLPARNQYIMLARIDYEHIKYGNISGVV
jgi:hypothetical protein